MHVRFIYFRACVFICVGRNLFRIKIMIAFRLSARTREQSDSRDMRADDLFYCLNIWAFHEEIVRFDEWGRKWTEVAFIWRVGFEFWCSGFQITGP